MKKYLACILAFALALALCACGGSVKPNETKGTTAPPETDMQGLEFESNGDDTCTLVGIGTYTGEELVISGTSPEGDTITAIGEAAFAGCDSIEKLTFDHAELTVDEGAFYNCTNLTEIIIKDSSLTLKDSVFEESGIETLQIDNSNVTAGDSVFAYCEGLVRVTVKNSTLEADDSFYSSGIQELALTDSNVIIGEGAFWDCYDLTSITAQGGTVEIGEQAFYECTGLTTVTLKCEASIGEDAFKYCENLTSVEFGDDDVELGELAFGYCEQLTTVTIGNADVDFGEDVFYGCPEDLVIYLDGKEFNGALEEVVPVVEKVFTVDNLSITLTDAFEVYETTDIYYAIISSNIGIAFIKEDFSTFTDLGLNPDEITLADYAEGSISANELSDSEVLEKDGITYFTFEATGYKYYSCVFKGPDAFWRINIYTYADNFNDMLPQFEQWAASVTFG